MNSPMSFNEQIDMCLAHATKKIEGANNYKDPAKSKYPQDSQRVFNQQVLDCLEQLMIVIEAQHKGEFPDQNPSDI